MRSPKIRFHGFTLIELLIVVAIIAILAAIAVPNFLEAQVRSKVSRVKSDMRSMVTALEAYNVDYNAYPKCNNFGLAGARFDPNEQNDPSRLVLERLSTPIAYMTNAFLKDPFFPQARTGTINSIDGSYNPSPMVTTLNKIYDESIKYMTPGPTGLQDVENPAEKAKWFFVLFSCGPDQIYPNLGGIFATATTPQAVSNNIYDATNGTVSRGDIYRIGGVTTGSTPTGNNYGHIFFTTVNALQK